jgi:hypothetical protein
MTTTGHPQPAHLSADIEGLKRSASHPNKNSRIASWPQWTSSITPQDVKLVTGDNAVASSAAAPIPTAPCASPALAAKAATSHIVAGARL